MPLRIWSEVSSVKRVSNILLKNKSGTYCLLYAAKKALQACAAAKVSPRAFITYNRRNSSKPARTDWLAILH